MATTVILDSSPFSPDRPFIWGVSGQNRMICGPGACDPTLRTTASGLVPFRYGTGAILATVAAAGSDIVIAAGASCVIGAEGVGDTLTQAGLWFTGGASTTNFEKSGAPSSRAYFFLLFGLAAAVNDAFQRAGTGAATTDPVFFSNWLLPEFGYQQYLIKAVMNYGGISVQTDETACTQRLGRLRDLPQIGGPAGDQTIRNGLTAVPGMYTPLVAAYLMGPKDENQAKFTVKMDFAITVQNNPVSPTVIIAGSNTASGVYIPVTLLLIGMLVCVPSASWCNPASWLDGMRVNGVQMPTPPL